MLKDRLIRQTPIHKGWSGDQKYCAVLQDGARCLLRISPIAQYERKKQEFERMQQAADLGVPMCLPLEFGTCAEGVYAIYSWIDGEDAEDLLPRLSAAKQAHYGLAAGKALQKIHQIPAPEGTEAWDSFFKRKADRKIKLYQSCPIHHENGQAFIDCINDNLPLLKDRPCTYQHGDYHIGNMMIGGDGQLYIIDFDRNDFGDPWEEFNRIVWCAQAAPLFATGMVNGYFDNTVPLAFWKLLALYISSNTLSSIPWALPYGEEQIKIMLDQAQDVLTWYDGMKNVIPTWYRGVLP